MNRREFAKQSCILCFGAMLGAVTLESCASIPSVTIKEKQNIIEIQQSSLAGSNMLRVKTMFLDYDILIVKDSSEQYNAIYLRCSHQDQPLSVMSDGLVCNSHGSRFNFHGTVVKEPAIQPLTRFKTEMRNNIIYVHVDEKIS